MPAKHAPSSSRDSKAEGHQPVCRLVSNPGGWAAASGDACCPLEKLVHWKPGMSAEMHSESETGTNRFN